MSASINVRPFQDADLEGIVALYKRGGLGPTVDGQTMTAQDFGNLLTEKGPLLFLIAEDLEKQTIVGTLGLFRTSGQRVARPGEAYATFFFIDPEHRIGSIPAWLFKNLLIGAIANGYTSISNTVSPANVAVLPMCRSGLASFASSHAFWITTGGLSCEAISQWLYEQL